MPLFLPLLRVQIYQKEGKKVVCSNDMYTEEELLFDLAVFYDIESKKKPQCKRKAVRLFKKLAREGHADSQYMYALMCAIGDGMRKNERKERYWFEKAAEQGHAGAQYSLGALLTRKEETRQLGFNWVKKAADQGHEEAMAYLAFCYDWAVGVNHDAEKSVAIYKKLAEMNNTDGLYVLGLAYQFGNGVEKNQSEAERLYRLAIDRGDARAVLQLENMLNPTEETTSVIDTNEICSEGTRAECPVRKKRIKYSAISLAISLMCLIITGLLFQQNTVYFSCHAGRSYCLFDGFRYKWPSVLLITGFGGVIHAILDAIKYMCLKTEYCVSRRGVRKVYQRLIPLFLCLALFQMPVVTRICLSLDEYQLQVGCLIGMEEEYSALYVKLLYSGALSLYTLVLMHIFHPYIDENRIINSARFSFLIFSACASVLMMWLNLRIQPWLIWVYIPALLVQVGIIIVCYTRLKTD